MLQHTAEYCVHCTMTLQFALSIPDDMLYCVVIPTLYLIRYNSYVTLQPSAPVQSIRQFRFEFRVVKGTFVPARISGVIYDYILLCVWRSSTLRNRYINLGNVTLFVCRPLQILYSFLEKRCCTRKRK